MTGFESRAAAKARLQAEGRWKQALAFREALKKQGVAPAEAFQQMLVRFPQLPDTNGQSAAPTNGQPAPPTDGAPPQSPATPRRRRRRLLYHQGPINLYLDVMWVYAHLPENTDIRNPSSPGALTLLEWARREPGQFFKLYIAKFLTEEGWREFVCDLKHFHESDLELTDAVMEFLGPLEDAEG
jgi:hypothetical protein